MDVSITNMAAEGRLASGLLCAEPGIEGDQLGIGQRHRRRKHPTATLAPLLDLSRSSLTLRSQNRASNTQELGRMG